LRAPLAICIPTFERAGHLERLLATLARELRGERIPVLVSDNASTDATGEVAEGFRGELADLRVHRQPENIGARRNVRWLLANAPDAEYTWCLGDDDVPTAGALDEIVRLLDGLRPTWLHLPHRWVAPDGSEKNPSPCPERVEEYPGNRELYLAYGHWLAFVSAQILRRDPLAEVVSDYDTPNMWAPFIWFFRAAGSGPCAVASRRLVEGGTEITWRAEESEILTRDFVGIYDEALADRVSREEFAREADRFYAEDAFLDHWRTRPLEELAAIVGRFPHSVRLRGFLFRLARDAARPDLFPRVEAAAREAGAEERASALVEEGESLFAAGDVEGADLRFRAAVAELPTLAVAWNDLAVACHTIGRHRAALAALDAALDLAPADEDALLNRANVQLALGDRAAAARDAERLLALRPGHEDAVRILDAAG
jgi:glycosyltransferase involved in cell wall biosynthesis